MKLSIFISQRERWLLLVFTSIVAFPVRDFAVDLKVTLHIPSSPGDLGFVPHYRPRWNLIHPSAQCTNNLLYTQAFFLINHHAKLIYCLFVQSEKASRLSFLSGEFSAQQSLKLNFTRSSFPTKMPKHVDLAKPLRDRGLCCADRRNPPGFR